MLFFKPAWVSHEGKTIIIYLQTKRSILRVLDCKPIFSVDIHPKGGRFATGGQGGSGGRIVIWNIGPVLNENEESDENIPKMLCQMDNHLGTYLKPNIIVYIVHKLNLSLCKRCTME